ncbi:unnamed protein product [Musa acuminata subsp. burmannicoides]
MTDGERTPAEESICRLAEGSGHSRVLRSLYSAVRTEEAPGARRRWWQRSSGGNGGRKGQDRLRVQGSTDRGLGGGEIAVTGAVRVQPGLRGYDRGGVPDEDPHHPAQKRKGADLGHRRSGEVLPLLFSGTLVGSSDLHVVARLMGFDHLYLKYSVVLAGYYLHMQ